MEVTLQLSMIKYFIQFPRTGENRNCDNGVKKLKGRYGRCFPLICIGFFRLYGPLETWFGKTWRLNEIEEVK